MNAIQYVLVLCMLIKSVYQGVFFLAEWHWCCTTWLRLSILSVSKGPQFLLFSHVLRRPQASTSHTWFRWVIYNSTTWKVPCRSRCNGVSQGSAALLFRLGEVDWQSWQSPSWSAFFFEYVFNTEQPLGFSLVVWNNHKHGFHHYLLNGVPQF